MIINPIIPVWLMGIVCVLLLILKRKGAFNYVRQILMVVLLFVVNLRIMIPDGEHTAVKANVDVLFVVDNTISMLAEDYDGDNRRMDAVKKDCEYIMQELSGASFSVVSFSNDVQRLTPYTSDADITMQAFASLNGQKELYARGTSINAALSYMKETLDTERDTYQVVFFISDGEITKEGETLELSEDIAQYIEHGAVLGYGTEEGGPMKVAPYMGAEEEYLEYYDYDEGYVKGISKIDEDNLKDIAEYMEVEYVHMEKQSAINDVLSDIQNAMKDETVEATTDPTKGATDIYYFFLIPFVVLLIFDFVYYKRKV